MNGPCHDTVISLKAAQSMEAMVTDYDALWLCQEVAVTDSRFEQRVLDHRALGIEVEVVFV